MDSNRAGLRLRVLELAVSRVASHTEAMARAGEYLKWILQEELEEDPKTDGNSEPEEPSDQGESA